MENVMEVNSTQPASGSGTEQTTQPNANDDQRTAMGKIFYNLLNKMLDVAKENSNSGA